MSVVTYKCPNCDGELAFDPTTQKFVCPYCVSSFTKIELDDVQPERQADRAGQTDPPALNAAAAGQGKAAPKKEAGKGETEACLFTCPSCGAEITAGSTTAATYCFYCHNPVILTGRLDGAFLPDKIVPFKIGREEAENRFLQWVKKKWFVPKAFFGKKNLEKITGVYFPYWLVDADLRADMTANAQKVRVWRVGDTEYTETSYYQLYRQADIHFEDIIKNALKKSNREIVDQVQPYNPTDMVGFSMPYLSGFQAEKRDIERAELAGEVQEDIQKYSAALLRDTMSGFTAVQTVSGGVQVGRENWDYTLLPVWTLVYQGKKKDTFYFYAMNGQTGKVYGKLPLHYGKLALAAGIIFAVVFLLLMLGGWLLCM
ncbi:MAG: TFIIB-type zinc ribbon-containing protein [Clostridiales bacterium]|nr:TFIIB-type zinc ribbon-containing protein [Clostridiales bacterium]